MRATYLYGAGDVRVIDVPDPVIQQPSDALVRVVSSCICGSDLHPYHNMPATPEGKSMGHEFVGVVEDVGSEVTTVRAGDFVIAPFAWSDRTCDFCREGLQTSCRHGGFWNANGAYGRARAYSEPLLPGVLEGKVDPGKVFDRTIDLTDVPDGYRAMDDRRALKVLVRP